LLALSFGRLEEEKHQTQVTEKVSTNEKDHRES
jgi:hypothetical protein